MASGPREVEYLRWNDAVARAFFGPRRAGELVHLDLDEKMLEQIGSEFGLDGPATLRALADSVTPLLVTDGSRRSVFDAFNKLTEAWYRTSRRQLEDLTRIGPPPIVALLALFALAGRHMSALAARTGKKSVSTFYPPLAVLLQAGQDNVKALETSVRKDSETYWDALRYWLEAFDGQLGLPSAYAVNHRPVGLALSQTLFGPSELRQLHQMFEDIELTTAQGMSAAELGIYIDFWLDIADTDVYNSLRSIWTNPLTRDPALQVALAQLDAWESAEGQMFPERSNELPEAPDVSCMVTGKHKVILPPMDPKAKAPWVFGRCKFCGLTKRYPGRLTKLSAVGQTGSVEALQFIGPDEGEYPGSWAPFKDILTFLGGGKRSSLSIVARQLENSERFEEWFVGHLQALGFLEVIRDENWTVRRWQVCSPALTQLVDGSILLTGGWKTDQEDAVTQAVGAQGGEVVVLSPEDHATTMLQDVDLDALSKLLPEGLCDVVYDAGPVMLDTLPPLSSVVAGLPLKEMQYNGVAERFVPADATW
ncbi:hypothetical protein K1Y78_56280, partial [Streptomyces sp. tea 10]|nr:hypothetical protein [Streptomyces sp. tea 10]